MPGSKKAKGEIKNGTKTKKRTSKDFQNPTPKKRKLSENDSPQSTPKLRDSKPKLDSEFLTNDLKYLENYRLKNFMRVEGDVTNFKPIESFDENYFSKDFLRATKKFKKPTPIQEQCWPIILAKKDVIGVAETGSGKTLAFGLPLLTLLSNKENILKQKDPSVLIIAPTRELAQQTETVLKEVGKEGNIKVVIVYGGMSKVHQLNNIKRGVNILIATPGRLLDFYNSGDIILEKVEYLVLDEADRLLDMGFEKDIRSIIQSINPHHQTSMFTATWPISVKSLADEFLSNPVKVVIGSDELSANHNIKQIIEVVENRSKDKRLLELLKEYHHTKKNRIIVFVLYKKEATWVERFLKQNNWNGISIHSDKTQQNREKALEAFRSGKIPLLIATDVAARGLDIPCVEFVINYTFSTIEGYVHRIGRTGRAGALGTAHTFFNRDNKAFSGELINILKEANQPVPQSLLNFGTTVKKKEVVGKISVSAKSVFFEDDSDD